MAFCLKPDGSVATLSKTNAVNPTFTPDKPGIYTLQLAVNDYFTDSAPSTVTVTATFRPKPDFSHAEFFYASYRRCPGSSHPT